MSVNSKGKLVLSTTLGEANPLWDGSAYPFLCLDMAKHAFEDQYGTDARSYATAFFSVVNWRRVTANFLQFALNKSPVPCVQGDLLAAPPRSL